MIVERQEKLKPPTVEEILVTEILATEVHYKHVYEFCGRGFKTRRGLNCQIARLGWIELSLGLCFELVFERERNGVKLFGNKIVFTLGRTNMFLLTFHVFADKYPGWLPILQNLPRGKWQTTLQTLHDVLFWQLKYFRSTWCLRVTSSSYEYHLSFTSIVFMYKIGRYVTEPASGLPIRVNKGRKSELY